MNRAVSHEAKQSTRPTCACGARFKTRGELRKHIEQETTDVREVWINTLLPVQPHHKDRR